MLNDYPEIPPCLRVTPQEAARRKAFWRQFAKRRKLKATKAFAVERPRREEDPTTKAFRRQIEKAAEAKKKAAILRLRENYGRKK